MPSLRVRFAKEGPGRFLSHLELLRTWERAIRRAGIPIAFSEGFNPHPRMNFASALAVGVESQAEYLDIGLSEQITPEEAARRLHGMLPEGLRVLRVTAAPDQGPALMSMVEAAAYRVEVRLLTPMDDTFLTRALADFRRLSAVIITRETKHGPKTRDILPGIYGLDGSTEDGVVTLLMELQANSEWTVRPEEVVRGLVEQAHLPLAMDKIRIRRNALYRREGDSLLAI